ncbi:outer membrane protein assembly factor BamB family protein [Chitinophaga pinensis]|uniref:Metallophosphoesterase n=1 Tax=Chitinophaga pinensis (strain ATCC 43595 / DSM 2588 / LMG 13176 / NBRC 15968 / NCIMB 11800 / UQM 2034) TaxID=485918 RepID=A0A979GB46_CHIPD|nr:PQQ-binding-like beta-propeller repeat protein [Chitinophaga pinensis]ACU64062.1 metallophosphoesterase [Chitinophaga pinensis DSM 2588]
MRKLIYLLLILLATIRVNAQDTLFRFALASDTHIGNKSGAEDLERTVLDINNHPDIAFVLFSGDITEFGSDEEIQLAKSIISKLNKPWYIVPGNHDSNWSESGCNTFLNVFGGETFSFRYKGYWFLGTSCGPNMRMGPGQVPREDLTWLKEQLRKEKDKKVPVIFVNHYPQDSALNNWYEQLEMLKDRNLKAILCGHGHANRKYDFEGIPGIMCRSNLRAKADTGAYNIISLVHDSLVFNERVPGGATLPAWHTVSIPVAATPQWVANPHRPSYAVNSQYTQVKERWSVQEPGDIGGGVAIADGKVVYSNTTGQIKAVHLASGKTIWQFKTKGKIYSTPLIYDNKVIVPGTDAQVYCLDLNTGKLRWRQSADKAIVASAALYKGLAIVAASDGHCRAYNIADGKLQWDFDSVHNFVQTRPLIYQDKVYFGSWGNDFYALDAATGKRVWTWNSGATNRMFSAAACWPVATGGRVFIAAPDQYLTALDAATGQVLWRKHDKQEWVRESMGLSADSNKVYVKTMQGHILGLDTHASGQEVIWRSPLEMGYEICPTAINQYQDVVYIPSQSGIISALAAKDGAVLWRHKISNCLLNNITAVDAHTVITCSADGRLVCLTY